MTKKMFLAFEGGLLDRVAELREDSVKLAAASAAGKVLPVWRGKPLMSAESPAGRQLEFLSETHPLVADRLQSLLFLGSANEQFYFAVDLSDWSPETGEGVEPGFVDRSEQNHPELAATQSFADLRANMAHLTALDAEIASTAKSMLGWHRSHRFCARCGTASTMTQAGWRRDCPSCGGQHFPRTDPVVIMLVTNGNSILLGRSPGWPDGMYSLLAGFVEPGETLETAVKREVAEETGVQVENVAYLASQPWPFPSSLMIGCKAEAVSRDLSIDTNEIEDAIWLTREELLSVFAGTHPTIKPARSGAIAGYLMENWLADRTP